MKTTMPIRALSIGVVLMMSTLAMADHPAPKADLQLRIVNPPGLYDPAPNGYSHAVVASGATHIAYIAGQGGEDERGRLAPSFAEQVKQAYANLHTALAAVGAKPRQVTKITTYVVDYEPSMLAVMTQQVQETFGAALPAQTLVPVARLALDGMLFEVDAVAVLQNPGPHTEAVRGATGPDAFSVNRERLLGVGPNQ